MSQKIGQLALEYCGKRLPVQVLQSNAGFYLGTASEEGPCSRESVEYWGTQDSAAAALTNNKWTQRSNP